MVFKVREVHSGLKKKGFALDNEHHKYLYFYYQGKRVGPYTFTSHGKPADDVGHENVKSMRKQLALQSNKQVHELVECPMTEAQYIAILRKDGVLPTE